MPNVIDAPNPVAFLDDVAAGLPVVPGRSVEVGRRARACVRSFSERTGIS